jgi:HAD superfamily hydrolase (TIGR01549 family)
MSQQNSKPYLLLDAGGVLVFPDTDLLVKIAARDGIVITPEKLFEAHCRLFHAADCQTRQEGVFPGFSDGYYYALYQYAGASGEALAKAAKLAVEHDRQVSGWTATRPWVSETLENLAGSGYRMAVISNSDGRAEKILTDLGLRDHFEAVFDSHILGVEKPDPWIFQIALESLGLESSAAIYFGDMYMIDVWGANGVGLGAVHLDALGLYKDWPGVHLPDIRHLPSWLPGYKEAELFPLKDRPLR